MRCEINSFGNQNQASHKHNLIATVPGCFRVLLNARELYVRCHSSACLQTTQCGTILLAFLIVCLSLFIGVLLRYIRCHSRYSKQNFLVAFIVVTSLLPEDHRSIEKRRCKRPDRRLSFLIRFLQLAAQHIAAPAGGGLHLSLCSTEMSQRSSRTNSRTSPARSRRPWN
jgi:hypothetical protein